MSIKKIALTALCGLIIGAAIIFSACGGSTKPDSTTTPPPALTPTPLVESEQDFAINPLHITGASPQERMDSLVSLLNKEIDGYAKIGLHKRVIVTGEKPEDTGVLYQYVLLVYADIQWTEKTLESGEKIEVKSEAYLNNIQKIVKQVLGYSAKFVIDAGEQSIVEAYVVFPDLDMRFYPLDIEAVTQLRDAPLESWSGLAPEVQLTVLAVDYLRKLLSFVEMTRAQQQQEQPSEK